MKKCKHKKLETESDADRFIDFILDAYFISLFIGGGLLVSLIVLGHYS